MKYILSTLSLFLLFSFNLHAQENSGSADEHHAHVAQHQHSGSDAHEHQEGNAQGESGSKANDQDQSQAYDSTAHGHQEGSTPTKGWDHPQEVTADFEDFPNLHPLFVHFPVVLLPFAAFFQILGLFVFKREMSWVVMVLVLSGFVAGYIAANFVHPHVGELPDHAQQVYDRHASYAIWTLWLSGIALLLKAGSHFFFKRVIWAESIVALVLLGAAFTVSVAGHHGSQLVFIEGVGPQGKHLKSENEGHSH